VIPYENCAAFYNTPTSREAAQICAGDENGGHGICYGDGGSPLFTTSGSQVGIASYTTGCARRNSFPGYTRISAYGTYIKEMICAMSDVPPVECAIPESALRKNRCGRSIRCAGRLGKTNFMSKRNIFGQCQYQCVSQSSVNWNMMIGRWKCGQTCFP
jgi:Trypsin